MRNTQEDLDGLFMRVSGPEVRIQKLIRWTPIAYGLSDLGGNERCDLVHCLFFLQDFQHNLGFEFGCISFTFHIPTLTSPSFVSKILGPL